MSIEAKVYAALRGLVADRCYPDVLPANPTYPAIAYQVISTSQTPVTQLANYADFHVQIGIHHETFAGLLMLRASAITAIKAMPEYVDYTEISGGFEFDPKTHVRFLTVRFRDTET